MPNLVALDDVAKSLVNNLRRFRNPLGLSIDKLTEWSKGLSFDNASDTYLYTGGLYQMIPYINSLIDGMNRLEGSIPGGIGMVKLLERFGFNVSSFYSSVTAKETARYNVIITNLYSLLKKEGINFGYLGDEEIYSGVILYDLGLDDEFGEIARQLAKKLKEKRVAKLITMDPHSTFILRSIYPKYVEGFDVEIVHYMELLKADKHKRDKDTSKIFSIHDPCLLARNLDLSQRYRDFAESLGLKIAEPLMSKRHTYCCGGPIENIAPRVSNSIAKNRCTQLAKLGSNALVACPICLSNLGRACKDRMNVYDLLEMV
ncbi:MAG: (Fe-S)-binding protein [Nitrososphaerota archaeon]